MVNAPIVHPALASTIPGFWPSVISIERATATLSPDTGQDVRVWGVVPGKGSLRARVAPVVSGPGTVNNDETRAGMHSWAKRGWHISIPGYHPDIDVLDRVAVQEEGRYWNVLGVEHDGFGQWTRLECEEIT